MFVYLCVRAEPAVSAVFRKPTPSVEANLMVKFASWVFFKKF